MNAVVGRHECALVERLHLDAPQHGLWKGAEKVPAQLERVEHVSVLEEILQQKTTAQITLSTAEARLSRMATCAGAGAPGRHTTPPLLRGARTHLAQKLAFELAQELEQQAVLMKQNKPAKNTAATPCHTAEICRRIT